MATHGLAAATARARSRATSRRAAPRGSAAARHVGHDGVVFNQFTAHARQSAWPQPSAIGSSNQSWQTGQDRAFFSFSDASRMRARSSSLSPAGVQGGGSLALRARRVAAAISVIDAFGCAQDAAPTEGGVSTAVHACWSAAHWLSSEVPSRRGCGLTLQVLATIRASS